MSANGGHTMVIKEDGSLWVWGYNGQGGLGLGSMGGFIDTPVFHSMHWKAISAGGNLFSLGIKEDGTLWGCGNTLYGVLGMGGLTNSIDTFAQVGTDSGWTAVDGGNRHSLGIRNGKLYSWGDNWYGQLGHGTQNNQIYTPTQIGTDSNWYQVIATFKSIALKTDGTLWAWGRNNNGQLGIGNTINQNAPVQIGTDTNWAAINGEVGQHTLALKKDGTLWTWGQNNFGQLGLGFTNNYVDTPTQVGTANDWVDIASGSYHSMALKADGTLWSWGDNRFGQLGHGNTIDRNIPTLVGTNYTHVTTRGLGSLTSLGVTDKGELYVWGRNHLGQLGIGVSQGNTILSPQRLNALPFINKINLSWTTLNNNSSIHGQSSADTINMYDGTSNTFYESGTCNVICSVTDTLDGQSCDLTYVTLQTDPSNAFVVNNQPSSLRYIYFKPHTVSPIKITLYYTQYDFDQYNAYPDVVNSSWDSLPTNSGDLNAINKIRVTRRNSLGGTAIIPYSIKWDADHSIWHVSIDAIDSGYYHLHTVNPMNAALYTKNPIPKTLKLYPNPTQDYIYLVDTKSSFDYEWLLTDLVGRVIKRGVYKSTLSSTSKEISLKSLPHGIYTLSVFHDNKRVEHFRFSKK